jgi:hypothetical protein
MKINVLDSNAHKTYRYLVNTNGGTVTISSKGANGAVTLPATRDQMEWTAAPDRMAPQAVRVR